ncbi:beta-lactamase-like protein [Nitzschia inconspicua]|uniref:Beta-lactamase-like protein n=1 Tax=Nitzschia inconspicua TaxID=303405 RepID=A0A9K3L4I3_9STRA|nr:beta-lactamase-like protein [Nitzschia inconspicua]
MNSSDACHVVEGCPGVYIDAFQGHFLRQKSKNPNALFILSHYHGDHYQQLPRNFKYQGPASIHCTPITARLLKEIHEVPSHLVVSHPYGATFDYEFQLPVDSKTADTSNSHKERRQDKVKVTFYDAHHCPGACIIVLELSNGNVHVHTGDMRYNASLFRTFPRLRIAVEKNKIDCVYLDTTYSHPKHDFLPQEVAIDTIASQTQALLAKNSSDRHSNSRTLVMLSCYSIGKEKVLLESSRRCNQPVYVSAKKLRMLQCIDNNGETFVSKEDGHSISVSANEPTSTYTRDLSTSDIHVIPMGLAGEMWPFFRPNFQKIAKYVQDLDFGIVPPETEMGGASPNDAAPTSKRSSYDKVVAFIPTGWANASNWNKKNAISIKDVVIESIHGTPRTIHVEVRLVSYSEHSSFSELQAFVQYLRPRTVIPTVFSNEVDSQKIVTRFQHLLDHTKAQKAFFRTMVSKVDNAPPAQDEYMTTNNEKKPSDDSIVKHQQFCNTSPCQHDTDNDNVEITQIRSVPASEESPGNITLSHVDTLVTMGFPEQEARRCLFQCSNNMSMAIDSLLGACSVQSAEIHRTCRDAVNGTDQRGKSQKAEAFGAGKRKRSTECTQGTQITDFFQVKR